MKLRLNACLTTVVFVLALPRSACAEPLGTLYPSLSVTNDYRFNGISLSDREAVLQGSLYWRSPDDYYGGLWASDVDFDDPNHTSLELDVYAGRRFATGDMELRIEGMYSSFDEKERGPTYDFFQTKVAASRNFAALLLSVSAAWTPDGTYGSGATWQFRTEAAYTVSGWLKASLSLGRGLIERRIDRTYWNAGLTARWQRVSFDIRYVDTSLSRQQCRDVDWCEAGVVGTLTFHVAPVKLMSIVNTVY